MPTAYYGDWSSPLTAAIVSAQGVAYSEPRLRGSSAWWIERRPSEGGRSVIVRHDGRHCRDVLPAPYCARSRAHEYGGGVYAVGDDRVVFVNDADRRVYSLLYPDSTPQALTSEGPYRHADLVLDEPRRRVVMVRETISSAREPRSSLVSVALDGTGEAVILVDGPDFLASPTLDRAGHQIAWLSWNHPDMPWDGTTLWCASLDAAGRLGAARRIAGGRGESIAQPLFSDSGVLYFVSDRSGYWNLYRADADGARALHPETAEYALPQWQFGMRTWGLAAGEIPVAAVWDRGIARLVRIREGAAQTYAHGEVTEVSALAVQGDTALMVASGPEAQPAVIRIDLHDGACEALAGGKSDALPPGFLSMPSALSWTGDDGGLVYGVYYAPRHPGLASPPGTSPPLIVRAHGGPTACAGNGLDLRTQYFTTRGFAVLDVNYRGSTGFGRQYRERLEGRWGVLDADDCASGARFLVGQGRVDPGRIAIRGSSAGGLTVLSALARHDVFRAGAVYYGVADLERLALDTHKFEAHYLDRLIGPLPECIEEYRRRSPVHCVGNIQAPVLFFQGSEDRVVPPSQTEAMCQALRAAGKEASVQVYAGEGHGFRRAETLCDALERELAFYQRCFGIARGGSRAQGYARRGGGIHPPKKTSSQRPTRRHPHGGSPS